MPRTVLPLHALAVLALTGCIIQPPADDGDGPGEASDSSVVSDGSPGRPDRAPADAPPGPAPGAPACLVFEPDTLEVALGSPGQGQDLETSLRNCGGSTLTVVDLRLLPDGQFNWSMDVDGLVGRSLAPGAALTVRLAHLTTGDVGEESALLVTAEDGAASVEPRLELVATPRLAPCAPDLLVGPSMGALTVAPDGHAFVVGGGMAPDLWRLAAIDLRTLVLTPHLTDISGGGSAIQSDWIERRGDEIWIFEAYPGFGYHILNRRTGEHRNVQDLPPPHTRQPHDFEGARWDVHVGSGDDGCRNVCITRQAAEGAVEMWFDDAQQPFHIHTGQVVFHRDHVYFMSHDSTEPAFRRISLRTGEVEVLHSFPARSVNAWVRTPVADGDNLYWLRGQQTDDGWSGTIDRLDLRSGALTRGHVAGLGLNPDGLRVAGDLLLWYDRDGVNTAPLAGGAATARFQGPQVMATYLDVFAGRVYFTRTGADGRGTFGCAPLGE